ncbi:MAG: hypothetical protein DWQ08_01415, partial [Proteobacteria bacterium]
MQATEDGPDYDHEASGSVARHSTGSTAARIGKAGPPGGRAPETARFQQSLRVSCAVPSGVVFYTMIAGFPALIESTARGMWRAGTSGLESGAFLEPTAPRYPDTRRPVMTATTRITPYARALRAMTTVATLALLASCSDTYFPDPEDRGGWRKNTSREFVASLGLDPRHVSGYGG